MPHTAIYLQPKGAKHASLRLGALAVVLICSGAEARGPIPSLTPLPIKVPASVQNSVLVGHTPASQILHVSVYMPFPNKSAVQTFVDSVSNPSSANYRNFVTPEQFGERFGQSPANVQQMVTFLQGQGFKITLQAKNNLTIIADCTVAQAEAAFHTTINNYHAKVESVAGRTDFYSFATPLQVPAALAPLITHIEGVQNYAKPVPKLKRAFINNAMASLKKFGNGTTLTPTMTRTLYSVAPMYNAGFQGQGRTIAISSFGGFRLSNVPLFYSKFALPTPVGGLGSNITVVPINGGLGTTSPNFEADLDIQMPLGMAPLSNFIVYDSNNPLDCLATEVNANAADIISDSYGFALDATQADAAHLSHVQMTAQGMTYMEATGDSGTLIEPFSYTDYEPECFQVGGTIANTDASGNRTAEVGWSGSGGGWVVKPNVWDILPTWQKGKGVPTNINFRLFPDVALHAAAANGAYVFFVNSSLQSGDGTSFSSPIFMGSLAVVEQKLISIGALPPDRAGKRRLGRVSDFIYSQNGRADIYHDITVGNNGTLPNGSTSNAGPFWDFVTGWGPMNFTAFAGSFRFVAPVTVFPASATVYSGQGQAPTGAVAQLTAIDGSYYGVGSVANVAGQVAAEQLIFNIPPKTDPILALNLTWTSNSTLASTEFTYLLNRRTNQLDILATNPLKTTSSTFTLTLSNPGDYVNGSGQVTLVRRSVVPPRIAKPFRFNLDEISFQASY